jgi:hypothetical protein
MSAKHVTLYHNIYDKVCHNDIYNPNCVNYCNKYPDKCNSSKVDYCTEKMNNGPYESVNDQICTDFCKGKNNPFCNGFREKVCKGITPDTKYDDLCGCDYDDNVYKEELNSYLNKHPNLKSDNALTSVINSHPNKCFSSKCGKNATAKNTLGSLTCPNSLCINTIVTEMEKGVITNYNPSQICDMKQVGNQYVKDYGGVRMKYQYYDGN